MSNTFICSHLTQDQKIDNQQHPPFSLGLGGMNTLLLVPLAFMYL